LTKSLGTVADSNGNGLTDAGDMMSFTFIVKNTGNLPLTTVTVSDAKATVVGGPLASLAVNASDTATFTATYVITQADIVAGGVENTATVSGTSPAGGAPVIDVSDSGAGTEGTETPGLGGSTDGNTTNDPTLSPLAAAPKLQLTKSLGAVADTNGNGLTDAGDTMSYTFIVKNTGNLALTNVTVTDAKATVVGGPISSLAVLASDSSTFTATYVFTQADIIAGGVENSATVSGTSPAGGALVTDVSDSGAGTEGIETPGLGGLTDGNTTNDPTLSPLLAAPKLQLTKNIGSIADTNGNTLTDAGDTMSFTFIVKNTGNLALINLTVTDAKATVVGGPLASLAVAASDTATFTASYVITQADIIAGGVENSATVSGTSPAGGAPVTDVSDSGAGTEGAETPGLGGSTDGNTTNDPTVTSLSPAPKLQLTKSLGTIADTNGNGFTDDGDTMNFTFTVKNTGNLALTNVAVSDAKATVVGGPLASLAVGATDSATFTASYVITETDLLAGGVENTATVSGTSPAGGALVTDVSDSGAGTEGTETPGLGGSTDGNTTNDPTLTPLVAAPKIQLTKILGVVSDTNGNTLTDAGDTIGYTFIVKNLGNMCIHNVAVTDPKATVVGGPISCLDVAQTDSTTFTATYVITPADIVAGGVENTATVQGTATGGAAVSDVSDSGAGTEGTETPGLGGSTDGNTTNDPTLAPLTAAPKLQLTKSLGTIVDTNVNSLTDAGDTMNYTFTVKNVGNLALSNLTVTDAKATVVGGPLASLAVLDSDTSTFTASYVITQADIVAGGVQNTATVSGTSPAGGAPVTDTSDSGAGTESTETPGAGGTTDGNPTNDPTFTSLTALPKLELTKLQISILDTNGDSVVDAGDTVNYTFKVKNTGNVALTNLTVTDAKAVVAGGPLASLAVGATDTATFTASYTLTQADMVAGGVENSATVSGTSPAGGASVTDVSDSGTGTETIETPGLGGTTDGNPTNDPTVTAMTVAPKLQLTKAVGTIADTNGNTLTDAGDTMSFTFMVKNTGNIALTNVIVTDAKASVSGGPIAILDVGATDSSTFTATYVITQADIVAGGVENTALVSGTNPAGGAPVTDVSDSGAGTESSETAGLGGSSDGNSTNDPTLTPLSLAPAINLVKTAGAITDLDGNGPDIGDTITYDFATTNTGNVSLSNVHISDPIVQFSALDPLGAPAIMIASLASGVDPTMTASLEPAAKPVLDANHISAPVQAYALSVERRAVRLMQSPEPVQAGERIAIYYALNNYGEGALTEIRTSMEGAEDFGAPLEILQANDKSISTLVSLYTLTAEDISSGFIHAKTLVKANSRGLEHQGVEARLIDVKGISNSQDIITASIAPNNIATVAVGQTVHFSGLYTLTQGDIDAGKVTNSATAIGDPPSGPSVQDISGTGAGAATNDTPTVVAIPQQPKIALAKSAGAIADLDGNGADAGDTILYTFVVSNEGNATLNGIAINDPVVGAVTCPVTSLAATVSTTCTKSYTLTQADVDLGSVTNTATVSGTTPLGATVSDTSGSSTTNDNPTVTSIPKLGKIALVKTAGTPTTNLGVNSTVSDELDIVIYTFVVENTGNVTLSNVSINDAKVSPISCSVATLAPAASTTCTGTYVLSLLDINTGAVTNTATAGGDTPGPGSTRVTDVSGSDKTNDMPTVLNLLQAPSINVVKTAAAPSVNLGANATLVDALDTIDYTFVVTNSGNVSLTGVSVTDAKIPSISCPLTTLVPAQSATCTGTYVITQADLNLGSITNTALASGAPPSGPAVSDVSGSASTNDTPTVSPLPQAPLIAVVKLAGALNDLDSNGADIGDMLNYTFTVTNQGNVSLGAVRVTDVKIAAIACPATTIEPTYSVACTGSYTLTQADIDAGQVKNQATAFGTPPTGTEVQDLSDNATPGQGAGLSSHAKSESYRR
jgi:large repetitive protein